MSNYALIHMCQTHCGDQSGLLLTIDLGKIPKDEFPLIQGKQILFKNPKSGGFSGGWVILVYDDIQNKIIHDFILSSQHPSFA